MKKSIIITLGVVFIIVLSFYYYVLLSPYGRRTQTNAKNIEKVSIGMKTDEVLQVMGKPDTIFPSYYKDGLTIYQYEPPFASSEGIDIYFDSTAIVKRVVFE